jgi:hypothetical protein
VIGRLRGNRKRGRMRLSICARLWSTNRMRARTEQESMEVHAAVCGLRRYSFHSSARHYEIRKNKKNERMSTPSGFPEGNGWLRLRWLKRDFDSTEVPNTQPDLRICASKRRSGAGNGRFDSRCRRCRRCSGAWVQDLGCCLACMDQPGLLMKREPNGRVRAALKTAW